MILSSIRLIRKENKDFMKKTKILVPALGILALGMAASVTGTVAWFTSATTVTAGQLTVAVASNSDLRINNEPAALATDSGWDASVAWTESDLQLLPATAIKGTAAATTSNYDCKARATANFTNVTYDDISFITADKAKVDAATGAAPAIVAGNNSANYADITEAQHGFMHEDYALKYEGYVVDNTDPEHPANKYTVNINTTITLQTTASKPIDQCIRVGVLNVTEKLFDVYTVGSHVEGAYTITPASFKLTSMSNSGAPKGFHVFVWYEGEDAGCINANAFSNSIQIGISHSIGAAE